MAFGGESRGGTITIGNSKVKESDYGKLLGVTFGKRLNLRKHNKDLCRKANQKIPVLLA